MKLKMSKLLNFIGPVRDAHIEAALRNTYGDIEIEVHKLSDSVVILAVEYPMATGAFKPAHSLHIWRIAKTANGRKYYQVWYDSLGTTGAHLAEARKQALAQAFSVQAGPPPTWSEDVKLDTVAGRYNSIVAPILRAFLGG